MRNRFSVPRAASLFAGALAFAATLFAMACAPGFLADSASTVPATYARVYLDQLVPQP